MHTPLYFQSIIPVFFHCYCESIVVFVENVSRYIDNSHTIVNK